MKILSFQFLRPAALFCLMASILAISTQQKISSRSWNKPLNVVIYPINADRSVATENYISGLDHSDFAEIDEWFSREARRYHLGVAKPLFTQLGPTVAEMPPRLPDQPSALQSLLWSLHLRYWVYRHTPDDLSNLHRVRVFVAFHTGEDNQPLSHSVGLQKGLIGVVHAFSLPHQAQQNNIVIAHEVLHTVGAIDKYTSSGNPVFPEGFSNPRRVPLYPQRYAEIMAGSIATSEHQSYMANSLKSTRINEITAREIAWLK